MKALTQAQQELYSAISGFDASSDIRSARAEEYYELTSTDERLEYLDAYAFNVLDAVLSDSDLEMVMQAL